MDYDVQELRIPADGYFTDEVIWNMEVLSTNFQANSAFIKYIIYGDCSNIEEASKLYEEEIANGTFYQNNDVNNTYGYGY